MPIRGLQEEAQVYSLTASKSHCCASVEHLGHMSVVPILKEQYSWKQNKPTNTFTGTQKSTI